MLHLRGLEFGHPVLRSGKFGKEVTGSPRFLGNPYMLALLSDPGRPTYLAIIDMPGTAIRFIRHRWPYNLAISWLNHTARILTVYAWRLGYPVPPKTRLAARWLDFGRVGLAPTGFQLQVSRGIGFLHPPEPGFAWRN